MTYELTESASRRAVKAVLGIRPLARTVIIFGDSLEKNNSSPGGSWSVNAQGLISFGSGYGEQAVYEAGGRYELIANAGVGGDTMDLMLARFQADILDRKPDVVLFGGIVNDIVFGMPDAALAVALNKKEQMLVRMLQAGILPVVIGCGPKANCGPLVRRVRWYEHEMCRFYGVPYVDRYGLVVDAATGEMAAAYKNPAQDGIHLGAAGNALVAARAAYVLKNLETSFCHAYFAHASNGGVNSADNLIANGSFGLGDASSTTSLNGWNQQRANATVTLPAASLPSTAREFSYVKTDTADQFALLSAAGPSAFAPGDVLHHAARLSVSGLDPSTALGFSLAVQFYIPGASVQNLLAGNIQNHGLAEMVHRLTVPLGATAASQLQFKIRDPGTYRLTNWTLVNVTSMAAAWKPGQQAGYTIF